ncbi:hypothetical protein ACFL6O_06555, partial [candidate division KSB1 bacterium]
NDNYVRITCDHDNNRRKVDLYGPDMKLIKKLHEGSYNWNSKTAFVPRITTVCSDGRIFISDSENGFIINVFDYHGVHLRTIDKNDIIEKIRITDEHKEAYFDEVKNTQSEWVYNNAKNNDFPEFFPQIHNFQVSGNRIYGTTFNRNNDRHELLILDLEGNILKRDFVEMRSKMNYRRILRTDLFAFDNGTLYEIVKNNETGNWEFLKTVIQ